MERCFDSAGIAVHEHDLTAKEASPHAHKYYSTDSELQEDDSRLIRFRIEEEEEGAGEAVDSRE